MTGKNDIAEKPPAEDWPNSVRNREELDSALESGFKSGRSPRTIPEIAERVLRQTKNG